MFHFADVTENGFASSVPWRLLFKRYTELIVLTVLTRKKQETRIILTMHEWNKETKRDSLTFYFDVIRRRLLSVKIEG